MDQPPIDDPQATSDRRREERFERSTYASIATPGLAGSNQAFCVVVDVSRGGMKLRTPQPPASGQIVTVRVGVEEDLHEIRARVMRVVPGPTGYDVGLAFDPDTPGAAEFFETFLRSSRPC